MLDFLKSDICIIIILIMNIILFMMVITSNKRIKSIKKSDRDFMRKLGDGTNLKEDFRTYIEKVEKLEAVVSEMKVQDNIMDSKISTCFQKIGIVRYNAYKDTAGDLSFAVAILDQNDDGVVFHGIYSREMSNIYAKPVANGKSSYNLLKEENEAILKAMDSDNNIRRKR